MQHKNKIKESSSKNMMIVLNSKEFSKEFDIKFDKFFWQVTVNGLPISDNIESKMHLFISTRWELDFSVRRFRNYIDARAEERKTNWLGEWLDALPEWDGKPRFGSIYDLLITPESALAGDRDLDEMIIRKTLLGVIARVENEWEMVRHMAVLVGVQNQGKSALWRKLTPKLPDGRHAFADSLTFKELNKGANGMRDLIKMMQGAVFVEFPEMTGIKRTDAESVKMFISMSHGSFVDKYKVDSAPSPIIACPVSTANNMDLFNDTSGATRFLPILCDKDVIDTKWVEDNLDQIWAEAVHCYKQGENHWVEKHEPEYGRLQDRVATYREVWGAAGELYSFAENGEDVFSVWFIDNDTLKSFAGSVAENNPTDKKMTMTGIEAAMTKAGWKSNKTFPHNKNWKFKVTSADIKEFGEFIYGKPRKLGAIIRVPSGWIKIDNWEEFADKGESEKARLFTRKYIATQDELLKAWAPDEFA